MFGLSDDCCWYSLYFTNRCTINCGSKVSTNKRMIIEAICSGPYCLEDISYSWALYQFTLLGNGPSWLKVQNLESYTLTNLDSTNIAFSGSKKPLEQKSKYKVVASVLLREGIVESGEMIFYTNSPPSNPDHKLGCDIHPKKGRVLKTEFNVTCYGWEDEDLPLSYQLRWDFSASSCKIHLTILNNYNSFLRRYKNQRNIFWESCPHCKIYFKKNSVSIFKLTILPHSAVEDETVIFFLTIELAKHRLYTKFKMNGTYMSNLKHLSVSVNKIYGKVL